MAVIHDLQASREMTPQEQQQARMIGCLMACAKNLQTFHKSIVQEDGDAGAACSIDLLVCLHRIYGGDGRAMERDVLALGSLLGFNVQQYNVGPHSGVSH